MASAPAQQPTLTVEQARGEITELHRFTIKLLLYYLLLNHVYIKCHNKGKHQNVRKQIKEEEKQPGKRWEVYNKILNKKAFKLF